MYKKYSMIKKKKVSLVLTTINKVSKNILNIEKRCQKKNWEFQVIGDKKTPKNFKLNYGIFYSLSDQYKLGLNYTKKSLVNSYARKNVAYLMSIKNGADIIIETDDDNYPLNNFFKERSLVHKFYQVKNKGWINIYDIFKRDKSLIWPRGLPLSEILKKKKFKFKLKKNKCFIQQGLCNLNPDVDAIFRLINDQINVKFKSNLKIGISNNSITAFNSQNTTWFKEAFSLLYLPSTCTMRATDIWRSFVAQRIMWENDWYLLYHDATVWQERNVHDLMKDFKDEIPGYLNNDRIVKTLEDLNIKSGEQFLGENVLKCYQAFVDMELVGQEEIKLIHAWNEDLDKLIST